MPNLSLILILTLLLVFGAGNDARSDETLVTSIDLPGASLDQKITYSPNKSEYEKTRDEILARLRKKDPAAQINPRNGPWMRVETTAKIGFEYKGVGASDGREHLRQISAAEEALFKFDEEQKK